MRYLFTSSCLLLCCALCAQTWSTLNLPFAGRYDDVFFLNDSVGWACNSDGRIYRTTNSGANWVSQAQTGNYLRCIEFMDADTGFCGGLSASGTLYRTIDSGQNWTNITSAIPGSNHGICGLSCPGGQVIYGCGRWSEPAFVIKSTDGGQNWQKINLGAQASALVDIFFISPDSGWVSGIAQPATDGGIILSTSDGGLNWHTRVKTGYANDWVWKMQTPDSIHFFASIERYEMPGANTEMLKSSDGGTTWSKRQVSPVSNRMQMIGFLDELHGIAGDNHLFTSVDGGESWQQAAVAPATGFNRFWRMGPTSAIVSSDRILRYSMTNTAVGEAPGQPTAEAHRLSVSPNPSTGRLNIEVELSARTLVQLKIIPIDGSSAEKLIWDGEHPAGTYRFPVDWPVKNAGETLLVWFKTNHGTQQRLVTILRGK